MASDGPAGPSSATATATGSGSSSTRPPRHTDLIFPSAEQHASMSSLLGSLKRSTLSVHNRLASIHADARFVSRAAAALSTTTVATTTDSTAMNTTKNGKTKRGKRQRQRQRQRRPLVANERCGSWYVPPGDKAASAYFKSTDGHERAWKFSTRRLNLHLVELIEKNDGIIIVDSTRRGKRMPDALSTTVPVWCAVLNRVLLPHHPLSQELHLPPHLLPSTHAQVSALLPAFADSLRALRLGDALPRCLTKPLRPLWVTQDSALRFRDEDVDVGNDADEGVDGRDDDGDGDGDGVEVVDEEGYDHSGSGAEEQEEEQEEEEDDDDGTLFQDYRPVICLTASKRILAGTEADAGGYIQGAADDTENWAHGLTPSLFWAHTAELLSAPDDALPDLIASLVASASSSSSIPSSSSPTAATGTSTATTTAGTASSPSSSSTTTPLITTHRLTPQISVCALPLGASATAPPPAPEDSAGARRGPTTCHIALGSAPTPKDTWVRSPTYMNVGLGKNKTASRNLRLALPEICSFAAKFLEKRGPDDQDGSGASLSELKGQQRPQIIIGCESGKDLSIGAALALSCYLFDDEGRVRAPTEGASFTKTLVKIRLGGIMTAYPECNPSRQTLQSVNSFLMDWRN